MNLLHSDAVPTPRKQKTMKTTKKKELAEQYVDSHSLMMQTLMTPYHESAQVEHVMSLKERRKTVGCEMEESAGGVLAVTSVVDHVKTTQQTEELAIHSVY
jgi:hypothetical protein